MEQGPRHALVNQPEKKANESLAYYKKMAFDIQDALITKFASMGIDFNTVGMHNLKVDDLEFPNETYMFTYYSYRGELLVKVFIEEYRDDKGTLKIWYQVFIQKPKAYGVIGHA